MITTETSEDIDPILILLSGKMQSGKNTFARLARESLLDDKRIITKEYSLAKFLKDTTKEAFSIQDAYLNTLVEDLLCTAKDIFQKDLYENITTKLNKLIVKPHNYYEDKTTLSRLHLTTSADLMKKVDLDVFVNFLEGIIQSDFSKGVSNIGFITDIRYPFEIEYFRENFDNVFVVNVRRDRELNNVSNQHYSERALDNYEEFDYIINNDYSLEKYKLDIENVLYNIFKKTSVI